MNTGTKELNSILEELEELRRAEGQGGLGASKKLLQLV